MRRPALAVALLAALLLLPALPAREARLETVADEDRLEASDDIGAWSGKRLSLADVDRDGDLDVLAQNDNGRVYVIDPGSGRAIVEVLPRYPYGPDLGPFNGPKAADLDGDGIVELVNVNRAAVVSVWSLHPSAGGLTPQLRWERHLDDLHARPSADAAPLLADLDQDGDLEIVAQTEETGVYALQHDGSLLWSVAQYGGNAEPLAHDVDGDGDLDVVVWTDAGVAYAVDGPTGTILWRFKARDHGVWPGSAVSSGLVGDLDGDGRVEVVFCARNVEDATTDHAPGAPRYREHHFALLLLRDGELVWLRKPSWGNPLCSAYLMAHDADGDGRKEIFGMDWNTIGHKPGDWERLGPAHAFAFDLDGRERWHVTLDAWNARAPVAMADFDDDGDQDVLAYDADGLVALDARTGSREGRIDLDGWAVKQGPLVANVDVTPGLEIVLAVDGASDAILVYALGDREAAPAWPGWELPVASPRLKPPSEAAAPEPPEVVAGAVVDEDGLESVPREAPRDAPTPLPAALAVAALAAAVSCRRARMPRR